MLALKNPLTMLGTYPYGQRRRPQQAKATSLGESMFVQNRDIGMPGIKSCPRGLPLGGINEVNFLDLKRGDGKQTGNVPT